MLRKHARLRREYVYRKSIEQRDRAIHEKKERLRDALDANETLPTDLRKEAIDIERTLGWDDATTKEIDDEYRFAGVEDPKVMVTTSRDPSSKLKMFSKEIKLVFPNAQRINRGNYEVKQLVEACRSNDVTDLVILHEHRGVPDALVVSHLPFGPTAYFTMYNVVMRHDIPNIGTMTEAYPHLIFDNFKSKLGERVRNILKYLFPVPKDDSKRVVTFANRDDHISFRHHTHKTVDKVTTLTEIGPRFELRLYKIVLGTLENSDSAEVEWAFKPYMNTSRKRKFLAE